MKFLCDTNIVSEVMRKSPNLAIKNWMNGLVLICLSVITIEEVHLYLRQAKI